MYFKVSGTHTIYLTGNYVLPSDDTPDGMDDMYDSDEEDEYDMGSDDEIDIDDGEESDELDGM